MKTIHLTKKIKLHFYRNYSDIVEIGITIAKDYICFEIIFWSFEIDW